ncbi:Ger(x)C family spore germination protein [Bacillus sp. J37]|uniref:Ger(x)C family spore germination protein n=1 Tax=Bacillus sp. J37 TaxID=935837 RepID=UPI00047B650E|nr:Ger(x)C family spore germination protein [Bacillus sp. J37]
MKKIRALFLVSLLAVLTSCHNVKEIHNQAYAVGMGVDYVEGEYHIILQFLDFSNVAKTDQQKSAEPVPVWMAKGKGRTIETALNDIFNTIQMRVNFEQLNLVLFGENMIASTKQLEEAFNTFTSSFTVRLTAWSYITKEKLEDVFTSSIIFDFPFSYSRLNQPDEGSKQSATVQAISLREFVMQLNEKTKTTIVPSIKINKDLMMKEKTKEPAAVIDGAHLFKDKTYKGWLSIQELTGFIWTNNNSERSITEFEPEKGKILAVELLEPNLKLIPEKVKGSYNIEVDLTALIKESVDQHVTQNNIKKEIENLIKEEVEKTYKTAKKLGADIFQLEDHAYRYHLKDWRKYKEEQKNIYLSDVTVNVQTLYSIDKYKSIKIDANTKRE